MEKKIEVLFAELGNVKGLAFVYGGTTYILVNTELNQEEMFYHMNKHYDKIRNNPTVESYLF